MTEIQLDSTQIEQLRGKAWGNRLGDLPGFPESLNPKYLESRERNFDISIILRDPSAQDIDIVLWSKATQNTAKLSELLPQAINLKSLISL